MSSPVKSPSRLRGGPVGPRERRFSARRAFETFRVGTLSLGIALLFFAAQVPAFADWPTYHKDAARTGYDSTAPALTSATQQWAHTGLDRTVYAEPLVY